MIIRFIVKIWFFTKLLFRIFAKNSDFGSQDSQESNQFLSNKVISFEISNRNGIGVHFHERRFICCIPMTGVFMITARVVPKAAKIDALQNNSPITAKYG